MDIPVNANVECADGPCGKSTVVILDPVSRNVTHVVVRQKDLSHMQRLVPISLVKNSDPELIHLSCTSDELAKLEPFVETRFVPIDPAYSIEPELWLQEAMLWPYIIPEDVTVPVEDERVPPGELAVHRGAHVHATDGQVGRVDEFLVDPRSGHISHLVLREGHLWGRKDVTIPVSEIEHIEEDNVFLKLDKAGIESLPAIPVRRWWSE